VKTTEGGLCRAKRGNVANAKTCTGSIVFSHQDGLHKQVYRLAERETCICKSGFWSDVVRKKFGLRFRRKRRYCSSVQPDLLTVVLRKQGLRGCRRIETHNSLF